MNAGVCMNRIFTGFLLSALFISQPAWAGLFSSCEGASKEPRPEWVSKLDYSLPGFYVGVGSAGKEGKNREEQIKAAASNAKSNLAQGIEARIISENKQLTQVNKQGVQQDAQSNVTVSAEEVLRGLKTKDQWIDKDTCSVYTLVVISVDSVKQAKREKSMKLKFEKFKELLAEGEDRNKNQDIKLRRNFLENAQATLADIDLSLLQEEAQGKVYVKRLNDAIILMNKETSQVRGRMALVALNTDGTLNAGVMGKMLDQLRASDIPTERLLGACSTEDDCKTMAARRGFSKLALLKAASKVEISQMGARKGTITIIRTVYDIDNHKQQGPHTVSAQVIGWSNEELDWAAAAEKAMQGLN